MKVLLVEDNAKLSELIVRLIDCAGMTIDAVDCLDAALAALDVGHYDLILLDLTLPDGDGGALLRHVRRRGCSIPILILTARGQIVDRVEHLNAGADDYLVKPFSEEELLARVRALLRRVPQTKPEQLSAGNVELDTSALVLNVAGRPIELPRRELRVLGALLEHRDRVLSRDRLMQAVYSMDSEVTPNAIEAAVSRLRRRLEAGGATVTITALRGLGYILAESPAC